MRRLFGSLADKKLLFRQNSDAVLEKQLCSNAIALNKCAVKGTVVDAAVPAGWASCLQNGSLTTMFPGNLQCLFGSGQECFGDIVSGSVDHFVPKPLTWDSRRGQAAQNLRTGGYSLSFLHQLPDFRHQIGASVISAGDACQTGTDKNHKILTFILQTGW